MIMLNDEIRYEDGTYERHNFDLYYQYLRHTKKRINSIELEHPFLGKKFYYNGKIVTIEKVLKQWYNGYYLTLLYVDDNNSHGTFYFENISSINKSIINQTSKFKDLFKICG